MIARLEDEDERFKYENYEELEEGAERSRYTPKKSKYSAGGGRKDHSVCRFGMRRGRHLRKS